MTRLHHVSVGVNDVARAKTFYEPLMKILRLRVLKETATAVHYGVDSIIFSLETPVDRKPATAGNGAHIAFGAPDTATVDAFYREAMRLGARDGGAPGPRPKYSAGYYGAFVFDPEGNKLEAVLDHL
jgi:catechol 2,3-dioxygenase-like lactoylglutathione lyase family enzyme